jgi:hypothetical protein
VEPESNIPAYPWLQENIVSGELTAKKMQVLQALGVPYEEQDMLSAAEAVAGKSVVQALILAWATCDMGYPLTVCANVTHWLPSPCTVGNWANDILVCCHIDCMLRWSHHRCQCLA